MSFCVFPCFAVFGAPQMLATNKDLRTVSLYASKQSTGRTTKRPHFARTRGGVVTFSLLISEDFVFFFRR